MGAHKVADAFVHICIYVLLVTSRHHLYVHACTVPYKGNGLYRGCVGRSPIVLVACMLSGPRPAGGQEPPPEVAQAYFLGDLVSITGPGVECRGH